MLYQDILTSAAVYAHNKNPGLSLNRLIMVGQAIFPMVEEELAQSVAMNLRHPWRIVLADQTPPLANGARIPEVTTGTSRIIGVYGTVRDSTDLTPCQDTFTIEEIRMLNNNPNNWRLIPTYAFKIERPRIYHTRTNVIIECCTYDIVAQASNIAGNGTPIFNNADGAYISALAMKFMDPGSKFMVDEQGQIMKVIMGMTGGKKPEMAAA